MSTLAPSPNEDLPVSLLDAMWRRGLPVAGAYVNTARLVVWLIFTSVHQCCRPIFELASDAGRSNSLLIFCPGLYFLPFFDFVSGSSLSALAFILSCFMFRYFACNSLLHWSGDVLRCLHDDETTMEGGDLDGGMGGGWHGRELGMGGRLGWLVDWLDGPVRLVRLGVEWMTLLLNFAPFPYESREFHAYVSSTGHAVKVSCCLLPPR